MDDPGFSVPAGWPGEEIASDFDHPPVHTSSRLLAAHFASAVARARAPLRNPHHEPKVDAADSERARPSAVLIPIVLHAPRPTVLLTRRHHAISSGGHICFPGGGAEPGDAGPVETALRETEEEIGLARSAIRVLGSLGEYVTHSGHRITPVVGTTAPPLLLTPQPGEVEEVLEVPLDTVLDARTYHLHRAPTVAPRAHFYLKHEGAIVAGATVSILMGFYEELLKTHGPVGASADGA